MFDFINDIIMFFKPFPGGFDMEFDEVYKEIFEIILDYITSFFA